MVRSVTGDILQDDADMLVNPVNCVGVMGAGLALAFKNKFPENFRSYRNARNAKRLTPGGIWPNYGEPIIGNFATKGDWRDSSKLEWVEKGLRSLASFVETHRLKSVAIPAIGCGLGGLSWCDVLPLIEMAFSGLSDVDVRVYPPKGPN